MYECADPAPIPNHMDRTHRLTLTLIRHLIITHAVPCTASFENAPSSPAFQPFCRLELFPKAKSASEQQRQHGADGPGRRRDA